MHNARYELEIWNAVFEMHMPAFNFKTFVQGASPVWRSLFYYDPTNGPAIMHGEGSDPIMALITPLEPATQILFSGLRVETLTTEHPFVRTVIDKITPHLLAPMQDSPTIVLKNITWRATLVAPYVFPETLPLPAKEGRDERRPGYEWKNDAGQSALVIPAKSPLGNIVMTGPMPRTEAVCIADAIVDAYAFTAETK